MTSCQGTCKASPYKDSKSSPVGNMLLKLLYGVLIFFIHLDCELWHALGSAMAILFTNSSPSFDQIKR